MRRAIRTWATQWGASRREVDDIVLATGEAATNVIEHAYGPSGGPLEIRATHRHGEIVVSVRDEGHLAGPREDGRGRGFSLMAMLVDSIDINQHGTGTEVRLHRRLGAEVDETELAPPVTTPPVGASPAQGAESSRRGARRRRRSLPSMTLYHELLDQVQNDSAGLVIDLTPSTTSTAPACACSTA